LERKYDVLIEQCYGPGRFALQAPFAGLAVLNWRRDGGAVRTVEVHPRKRPDLVGAFRKDTGLFFAPDEPELHIPSLEDYARRLEQAPMLEITGGVDFPAATRSCRNFFRV
jgi:HprK-related kinase B